MNGVPIRFLLDNNMPDEVADPLTIGTSHLVERVRDRLVHDAPDEQIAVTAEASDYVIVSHDRDFRRYLPQAAESGREELRGGVVRMRTSELEVVARVRELLDVIEFHAMDARRRLVRLRLDIGKDYTTLHDVGRAPFADVEESLRFHYERSLRVGYTLSAELTSSYWKFNERQAKRRGQRAR